MTTTAHADRVAPGVIEGDGRARRAERRYMCRKTICSRSSSTTCSKPRGSTPGWATSRNRPGSTVLCSPCGSRPEEHPVERGLRGAGPNWRCTGSLPAGQGGARANHRDHALTAPRTIGWSRVDEVTSERVSVEDTAAAPWRPAGCHSALPGSRARSPPSQHGCLWLAVEGLVEAGGRSGPCQRGRRMSFLCWSWVSQQRSAFGHSSCLAGQSQLVGRQLCDDAAQCRPGHHHGAHRTNPCQMRDRVRSPIGCSRHCEQTRPCPNDHLAQPACAEPSDGGRTSATTVMGGDSCRSPLLAARLRSRRRCCVHDRLSSVGV